MGWMSFKQWGTAIVQTHVSSLHTIERVLPLWAQDCQSLYRLIHSKVHYNALLLSVSHLQPGFCYRLEGIGHPQVKMMSSFTVWVSFFCWTQKKIFWRMLVRKQFQFQKDTMAVSVNWNINLQLLVRNPNCDKQNCHLREKKEVIIVR